MPSFRKSGLGRWLLYQWHLLAKTWADHRIYSSSTAAISTAGAMSFLVAVITYQAAKYMKAPGLSPVWWKAGAVGAIGGCALWWFISLSLFRLGAPWRIHEKDQADVTRLTESVGRLEAATLGGDPIVIPSTMHVQQKGPTFALTPSSAGEYAGEFLIWHIPPTASEIDVVFTWPITFMMPTITNAEAPDTIEARELEEKLRMRVEGYGLYGRRITLSSPLRANSKLKLYVNSKRPIAMVSAKALF